MLLTVIVTFLAAVLSGLGVGSAGLLVTWLTLVEQMPQMAAQGTNLVFFIFSSGAALTIHAFRTPTLWQCVIFLVPLGLCGSLLGVSLATYLPQALLRRIFGYMLILTGGIGLFPRRRGASAHKGKQSF